MVKKTLLLYKKGKNNRKNETYKKNNTTRSILVNTNDIISLLKKRIINDKIQWVLFAGITVYTLIFSYFTILKHYSFDSGAYDLGIYEQMLWNTIHNGKLFWMAPDPVNPTGFFFGTHFSPILFLILPIYFLYQTTETLLVLQSFVLALGALPLYWLARDELKSKIAGLVFALAYLLYAPMHGVNWFDFHTQAFIPLFFNLAFYFFIKKQWRKYLICTILVLSVNEAMPGMIIAMGIYGIWTRRQSIREYLANQKTLFDDKTALISFSTIILGVVWFIIARKIINSINPALPFTMWSEFGTDLPAIIINMITNPLHTFEIMLGRDLIDKFFFIIELFLPLLFLSFLDPPSVFITLPWIVMSFLSNIPTYITPIGYQYPAHILSIIFVSAIFGFQRLNKIKEKVDSHLRNTWINSVKISNKQLQHIALGLIILCSISTFIGLSPLGINLKIGVNGRPFGSPSNEVLRDVISVIPNNASVTTQNNIFPIFARRMNTIPYPIKTLIDNTLVDYILVDTRNMWYHINIPFPHVKTNMSHFDELIAEVTKDESFGLLMAVDGIYLFQKNYQGAASTPTLNNGLTATFSNGTRKVGETHVLNIAWDWSRFSPFPGSINRHPNSTDSYKITFTGFIFLPQNGSYAFKLESDDNSTLQIDGFEVLNSNNNKTFDSLEMVTGFYKIEVQYQNLKETGTVRLYWKTPRNPKYFDFEIIPSQYFTTEKPEG
jgi:uncharacterized membrane protein